MVVKNLLYCIHKTIMKQSKKKRTPTSLRIDNVIRIAKDRLFTILEFIFQTAIRVIYFPFLYHKKTDVFTWQNLDNSIFAVRLRGIENLLLSCDRLCEGRDVQDEQVGFVYLLTLQHLAEISPSFYL